MLRCWCAASKQQTRRAKDEGIALPWEKESGGAGQCRPRATSQGSCEIVGSCRASQRPSLRRSPHGQWALGGGTHDGLIGSQASNLSRQNSLMRHSSHRLAGTAPGTGRPHPSCVCLLQILIRCFVVENPKTAFEPPICPRRQSRDVMRNFGVSPAALGFPLDVLFFSFSPLLFLTLSVLHSMSQSKLISPVPF